MKRKEIIKELYRVVGQLEGFTYLTNMPEGVAMSLSECVDRLEIIGAQLINKDVHGDEERKNAYQMAGKRILEACGRVYPAPQEDGAD